MSEAGEEIVTTYLGRSLRERRSSVCVPPCELPLMNPLQREMLGRWARADSLSRQWLPLLKSEEGRATIEEVEAFADLLLKQGWVGLTDRRDKFGNWLRYAITWLHLAELKNRLGLNTRAARMDQRVEVLQALSEWGRHHDDLQPAVETLAEGGTSLNLATLLRRIGLLHALADWKAGQCTGTRRDFEPHARGKTKSLASAEWQWLDECVDLRALGIERFAQQVWLAGALSLAWLAGSRVDLRALHCVGLVATDLLALVQADPPGHYWLIENRASFERQAAQRKSDVALIWLPGRPSGDWMAAVAALLQVAPAPARISADCDPAGVEIALTAAGLWEGQGLDWQPYLMGVDQLKLARHALSLDKEYDQATLTRLEKREGGLPELLRDLCEHMACENVKAEQEGWL